MTAVPIGLLRSYLAMLPRLSAERQHDAFQTAVVAGSIRIEPGDAARWAADLERAANGVTDRPRAAPATPEALAAMGIAVVMEPAHV